MKVAKEYDVKTINRFDYGKKVLIRNLFSFGSKVILLGIILAISSLYIVISVMLNNPDKSLYGFKMEIVKTGSMEPTIPVHSVVMIKKQDNYSMNEIINFIYKDQSYTHRIVEVGDGIYKTKGDANNVVDTETVNKEAIVGEVVYHSAALGNVLMYIRSVPIVLYCVIVGSVFLLITILLFSFKDSIIDLTDEEKIKYNTKSINSFMFRQKIFMFNPKLCLKFFKNKKYDIIE